MNTKEIEERHDYHGTKPFPNTATMWEDIARAAHKDRGDLLQEVKRMEAFVEKVRALPIAYTMHIYENITVPREYDSRFISKEGLDQALADLDRANNKETQ